MLYYANKKEIANNDSNNNNNSNNNNSIQTIRRQSGDELFECVWPFCGVGAQKINKLFHFRLTFSQLLENVYETGRVSNLLPPDRMALPPSQTPHKIATNLNLSITTLQNKILEIKFFSHGKLLNIPIPTLLNNAA